MQNKGLVKFIAIIFALVSIYQLSFTFVTDHYEKKAKEFAKGDLTKEARYLDSIANEKVYLGQTFAEVRSKEVQKGLDLEGGINVMLQISVKDILKGLANNSKNAVFNQALVEAEKNREGNQSYLESFYVTFDKLSKGSVKLSSSEIFANRNLQEVNTSMTDAQVKTILNKKVAESVESAFRVISERIDKFGVASPTIQKVGESGRILVELPGAKDIDRIKNLLQSTAQLEFWETFKGEEVGQFLMAANNVLKERKTKQPEVSKDTLKEQKAETDVDKLLTGVSKDTTANAQQDLGPIVSLIKAPGYQGSPIIAFFATKDTAQINSYLKDPQVRSLLNGDLRYVKFAWGKAKKDANIVELYALRGNAQNVPPLSGAVITEARQDYDNLNKAVVSMQMNPNGAKIWEDLTRKANAQQSNIAIVLDNIVYSAPGVTQQGGIAGGSSSISGDFTVQEAKDLANILKAGKLPASADIVSSEVIGPSLGQAAIDAGLLSSVVGLILVAAWMVFYYGKAGWYA